MSHAHFLVQAYTNRSPQPPKFPTNISLQAHTSFAGPSLSRQPLPSFTLHTSTIKLLSQQNHLPNCQFTIFQYISFPTHCLAYISFISFHLLQISPVYHSNISLHINTHNFRSFPILKFGAFSPYKFFPCNYFEVRQPSVWLYLNPAKLPCL